MAMNNRDYQLVAGVLEFCKGKDARTPEEMRAEIVRALGDTFREMDPTFIQDRFNAACGVEN